MTGITVALFCTSCRTHTAYQHIRDGESCAAPHGHINCPLCQVASEEIETATKLLEKAGRKLRGISDVPTQRIADLDNARRQLRQLSCILDSCAISTSYEVSQAQKALLLLPRTEKGSSTSSDERYFFFLRYGRSRSKARSLDEKKLLVRKLLHGRRWSHAAWQITTTKTQGKTQIPQPDLRLTIRKTAKQTANGARAQLATTRDLPRTQWQKPTVSQ